MALIEGSSIRQVGALSSHTARTGHVVAVPVMEFACHCMHDCRYA